MRYNRILKLGALIGALVFCATSGCVVTPYRVPQRNALPVLADATGARVVPLVGGAAYNPETGYYDLYVSIERLDRSYNCMVQEIDLGDGVFLVEAFQGRGRLVDHHRGYGPRRMRLYPADVVGADWSEIGFAHLPRNQDGSVVTNVPANFNADYQARYKTTGRIVRAARESAVLWRIDLHDDHLEVYGLGVAMR